MYGMIAIVTAAADIVWTTESFYSGSGKNTTQP